MAEQGSLKFLTDQHISPVLVRILSHLGRKGIRHIKDTDLSETNDEHWVPVATKRGYICVSCDRNMMNDDNIARALINARARMIFLGDAFVHSGRWKQAQWILRHWEKIEEFAGSMKPGDMVKVAWNGRITPMVPGSRRCRAKQQRKHRE